MTKNFSFKSLCWFSFVTWAGVGIFLSALGVKLLFLQNVHMPEHFSLIDFFSTYMGDKNQTLFLLLIVGLVIGYLKGKYILKKTVNKQISRLNNINRPLLLKDVYTKKYLLLIVMMMSLGFILRSLPIHPEIRGIVDITVGAALLFGASNYIPLII